MAPLFSFLVLLFSLVVAARFVPAVTSQSLKASVACLDCGNHQYDYSDIQVAVKCDKVDKLTRGVTESDGSFAVELPASANSNSNCVAKLLGGRTELYVSKSNSIRQVVAGPENSYTLSAPLTFYTSNPIKSQVGASKTVDIPLPPEWGLAPSSYYLTPYVPIIGIP